MGSPDRKTCLMDAWIYAVVVHIGKMGKMPNFAALLFLKR